MDFRHTLYIILVHYTTETVDSSEYYTLIYACISQFLYILSTSKVCIHLSYIPNFYQILSIIFDMTQCNETVQCTDPPPPSLSLSLIPTSYSYLEITTKIPTVKPWPKISHSTTPNTNEYYSQQHHCLLHSVMDVKLSTALSWIILSTSWPCTLVPSVIISASPSNIIHLHCTISPSQSHSASLLLIQAGSSAHCHSAQFQE